MVIFRSFSNVHNDCYTYDNNSYSSTTKSIDLYSFKTVGFSFFPYIFYHLFICNKRSKDIWFVRIFVHNGLAIYGTWLYLATLLNLTVWLSQIYNRNSQSITDISTVSLTLTLLGIVIYFICENFIFYISMAYTYTPWFVLIFTLFGIVSKNSKRNDISDRNKTYTIALLIICCILFVIRLGLFLVRYIKQRIPTIQNP